MRTTLIILVYLIVGYNSNSQSHVQLDSLLSQFQGKSSAISESQHGKLVYSLGRKSLRELASFFSDTSVSKVFSTCNNRNLTKGEIAMVMADHIEMMPYQLLTGLQNCILIFCEENLNRIEYYFSAIEAMGRPKFTSNYLAWLSSKRRKKIRK